MISRPRAMYRVDLRLRPDTRRPLVNSLAHLEIYYESWENLGAPDASEGTNGGWQREASGANFAYHGHSSSVNI
jgi:hypothetical protein